MNEKFRLYAGLVKGDEWYNYATLKPVLDGGIISILDTVDSSTAKRIILAIEKSIDKLYTEDGKELEPTSKDIQNIKVVDAHKFGLELMKIVQKTDYPKFKEFFYCHVCSKPQHENYTEKYESWVKLIEDAVIDEIYCESAEEMRWLTELPVPIEVDGKGKIEIIERELINLDQMHKIQKTAGILDTDASYFNASWDSEICRIDIFDHKDLMRYIKRDLRDSFSRRYLTNDENTNAMINSKPVYGLDGSFRSVRCDTCGSEVGGQSDMGGLDFTNFFDFLLPKKKSRKQARVI